MSLDLKQLNAIEKAMLPVVDGDEAKTAEVKGAFEKFRKALKGGDAVTNEDIDTALMEVLVDEPVTKTKPVDGDVQLPDDPMAPIFDALFREVSPFVKGLKRGRLEELFHKAYGESLGEVETVIDQTVEATATELGAIQKHDDFAVGRGKNRIPPKPGGPKQGDMAGGGDIEDDDREQQDDGDDMYKILKSAGLSRLAKRFGEMQAEVAALTHDKAMGLFQKRATDAGVPGMAADLLAIHEIDPELCARVEKQLKANHEALRKGNGWSAEIGSGRDAIAEGVQGPLSQLNGLAQEMIQKGLKSANGKTITFAKAFSLACDQNPEIFAEYQRQKAREIARGGA